MLLAFLLFQGQWSSVECVRLDPRGAKYVRELVNDPFELCKVLQTGSLIGIARHVDDDHVVLTFRDRGVLVYNVSNE